jgi:Ca2+-binding RTX toxin-like protein
LAGLGNDIFTGGAGNNTFAFDSLSIGSDRIVDFNNTTRADHGTAIVLAQLEAGVTLHPTDLRVVA